MANYKSGDFIRFTYLHSPWERDEHTGDKFKEVLVLTPLWDKKMHGIDMKRLTAAEREVLEAIFDTEVLKAVREGGRPHRLPLVNDILKRMNPPDEVGSPVTFYSKFVKTFLRDKDAYRTYFPHRMSGVSVVKASRRPGPATPAKPLFHRPEPTKAPETKPTNRLDIIRQRAQQQKDKEKK